MITRIVKLTLKPESIQAFKNIFRNRKEFIVNQPGCHDVKLVSDINNLGVLFTISQWENENHLNAYRNSDLFKDIWPNIKPMFAEKAEAWSTEIC